MAVAGMLATAVVVVIFNDALKGPYMAIYFWLIVTLALLAPKLSAGD